MLRIFILNHNCLKMHKLHKISDKNMKGLLLTTFTVNFLDKVYDEV